jgi:ATP adenylyltransferase
MEELWTPWRMAYIVASRSESGCIFCRKPKEPGHHHYILHRGETTFTILNLYPYTEGHLMVIPYRHLPRLRALSAQEREEMALRLQQAESILRKAAGARWFHAGINLGRAAGAGVDGHLHAHLVPRGTAWQNGSKEKEAPPVDLETTYDLLRPHFSALG